MREMRVEVPRKPPINLQETSRISFFEIKSYGDSLNMINFLNGTKVTYKFKLIFVWVEIINIQLPR